MNKNCDLNAKYIIKPLLQQASIKEITNAFSISEKKCTGEILKFHKWHLTIFFVLYPEKKKTIFFETGSLFASQYT